MELWGMAKDMQSLHKELKKYPFSSCESYFAADKTFKIEVETFCKHLTQREKIEKLEVSSSNKGTLLGNRYIF